MTVKLADNAMTTLEAVFEMLGININTASDTARNNITRLINAASSWIENMSGRKFGRQDYTEYHKGTGSQELVVNQWPIRSVKQIKSTADGAVIPHNEYDITMTGYIGVIYKDNGWACKGYIGGLADDYIAENRYLEVMYTAGYILPKDETEDEPSDLPADIQNVIWGIVQQEFSIMRNGAQGLSAYSMSDISWTFDKEPRQSWLQTVNRYVRW